ncbi:MAG TPA: hypothetical protein VFO32_09040 [Sphingomicrobium sp.]|nr:hypothetical protein [Sphingomicrobium sp.]
MALASRSTSPIPTAIASSFDQSDARKSDPSAVAFYKPLTL